MDNKEMKEKLHERALITCVIMLIICVVFKLFGADWFDLNTEIEILQRADEIIMNSAILSFAYSFALTYISTYLIISIVTLNKGKSTTLLSALVVLCAMLSAKEVKASQAMYK